MAFCPNCGVELAPEAKSCPLCGGRMESDIRHPPERLLEPDDTEKLTEDELNTVSWEVLSVSAGIAAVVVCAVNLLDSRSLSWALYPLASLALVWVLVTAPLKLRKRPILATLLVALALPAFLMALNLIEGKPSWAPAVAIPIALDAELSTAVVVLASIKAKRKGGNVIAFGLFAVTALCVGVESTLGLYLNGHVALRWSAIVAAALVPVAGFLLYIHHRVIKKANLRKLFRL